MQVQDALQNVSSLAGNLVTIEGLFVMKKDAGYLVASEKDIENQGESIGIEVPNLKKILFAKVPALGGSQFSYCDEAKITGILTTRATGEFSVALIEIERLEIYKYGESLVAIP